MVMPIYLYGTTIWNTPVNKITLFDDKLVGLIRDMLETMHKSYGIGLSANQVGLPLSLAVMDLSELPDYSAEKPLVVINPEILESYGESTVEEGCLSIPGVRADVTRPEWIAVCFIDGNFREVKREFSGLWARVFQHEYDHLNQKFFVDRLSSMKRHLLKPKLSRIRRGMVRAGYSIISQVEEEKMKSEVKFSVIKGQPNIPSLTRSQNET